MWYTNIRKAPVRLKQTISETAFGWGCVWQLFVGFQIIHCNVLHSKVWTGHFLSVQHHKRFATIWMFLLLRFVQFAVSCDYKTKKTELLQKDQAGRQKEAVTASLSAHLSVWPFRTGANTSAISSGLTTHHTNCFIRYLPDVWNDLRRLHCS